MAHWRRNTEKKEKKKTPPKTKPVKKDAVQRAPTTKSKLAPKNGVKKASSQKISDSMIDPRLLSADLMAKKAILSNNNATSGNTTRKNPVPPQPRAAVKQNQAASAGSVANSLHDQTLLSHNSVQEQSNESMIAFPNISPKQISSHSAGSRYFECRF